MGEFNELFVSENSWIEIQFDLENKVTEAKINSKQRQAKLNLIHTLAWAWHNFSPSLFCVKSVLINSSCSILQLICLVAIFLEKL